MAENTKIEWTDATWNPIAGCQVKSPGCTNCYAMRTVAPRLANNPATPHYHGTVKKVNGKYVWTGKIGISSDETFLKPMRWKRPRRIFVNSTSDLFHPNVPDEVRDRVFAVSALCPQHELQILTKHPERAAEYLYPFDSRRSDALGKLVQSLGFEGPLESLQWPLPNVLIGASVERQQEADERRPHLAKIAEMGWRTFVSYEPALGPVDWTGWEFIVWLISGGESGADARPSHPDWHRDARDFCAANGIPYHFKQWGEWVPFVGAVDGWNIPDDPEISKYDHCDWEGEHWSKPYRPMWCDELEDDTVSRIGKKYSGRLLDGVEHNGMPDTPTGSEERPAKRREHGEAIGEQEGRNDRLS